MEDFMIDIFVEELNSQFPEQTFTYMSGSKFYRVVRQAPQSTDPSVYCFIEKANGDAYYAASWAAPAPGGPRGNIATPEDMVTALDQCKETTAFAKR